MRDVPVAAVVFELLFLFRDLRDFVDWGFHCVKID